jgi:hypothetical protein
MDFEEQADHYIAWPFWTPDSRTLMVQWMNRGQDTIRFYNCDPATGSKTQVVGRVLRGPALLQRRRVPAAQQRGRLGPSVRAQS